MIERLLGKSPISPWKSDARRFNAIEDLRRALLCEWWNDLARNHLIYICCWTISVDCIFSFLYKYPYIIFISPDCMTLRSGSDLVRCCLMWPDSLIWMLAGSTHHNRMLKALPLDEEGSMIWNLESTSAHCWRWLILCWAQVPRTATLAGFFPASWLVV